MKPLFPQFLGPIRANRHPHENGAWTAPARPAPKSVPEVTDPAALKALRAACPGRFSPPEPLPPVLAYRRIPVFKTESVATLSLSYNPPRFKVLKKGPRKGQTAEVKRSVRIITRRVSDGDGVDYVFTSRSTQVRVSTGIILLKTQVRDTFTRRWPALADDLMAWLFLE